MHPAWEEDRHRLLRVAVIMFPACVPTLLCLMFGLLRRSMLCLVPTYDSTVTAQHVATRVYVHHVHTYFLLYLYFSVFTMFTTV